MTATAPRSSYKKLLGFGLVITACFAAAFFVTTFFVAAFFAASFRGRGFGRLLFRLLRTNGQHRDSFYLHFSEIFEQAADLNQRHRRKVLAHELTIRGAHVAKMRLVFFLVGNEDQQPGDVRRFPSRLAHDGEHVFECLGELLGEVIADDSPLAVPAYLSRNEQQRAALKQNSVAITARLT